MNAEPLPKEIYEKALNLGITEIQLHFSGGDDEGYLQIEFVIESEEGPKKILKPDLRDEIENWAFDAYCYSGAGDGIEYGDDFTYDLINKQVISSEWGWLSNREVRRLPFD